MSPIHGRVPLVLVALAGLAGCGGLLAPPDGAGSGGAAGGGGPAGSGGGITLGDAGRDLNSCLQVTELPATPIAGMPCSYVIPLPPCDILETARIGVKVDGVEIPRDPADVNGWDYTDPTFTRVDIHGPSCDALTSGAATTVTIVFRILI